MAAIIASGVVAAASSDFTIVSGENTTLFLVDAAGPAVPGTAVARVQIKAASNEYFDVGRLTIEQPAQVLSAPGTYRVVRDASPVAFGVDRT